MNQWTVDSEVLGRVHSTVMRRIRLRRQLRNGAAVCLAVVMLLVAVWPAPAKLESLTLSAPPPPAAPLWVPPPAPVHMTNAAARPAERITFFTDDPDVVIVLIADGGEE